VIAQFIAKHYNLNCDFVDFSKYIANKDNKLVSYLLSRGNSIPKSLLDKDGNSVRTPVNNSILRKLIRKVMYFTPVKYVSLFFANLLNSENNILGAILTKK
tara:strand:- start:3089 stop:3391 length:303 start_codon:yes stop_codon:yes gene_type:complete